MSRTVTLAGYAVMAAAAVAYQAAAIVTRRTPTIGDAFSVAVRRPAGRVAVFAWWLWIGWHFFVRSHV